MYRQVFSALISVRNIHKHAEAQNQERERRLRDSVYMILTASVSYSNKYRITAVYRLLLPWWDLFVAF